MAHNLSDRDSDFLDDLTRNKAAKLEAFKNEWSQTDTQAVRNELESLERYLAACARSEVDDTLENIIFMGEKAAILRELLGNTL